MAFARSETALTMLSRVNSTSELSAGLAHVLFDAHEKLPEDPEELQEPPKPLKHKSTCLCSYILPRLHLRMIYHTIFSVYDFGNFGDTSCHTVPVDTY